MQFFLFYVPLFAAIAAVDLVTGLPCSSLGNKKFQLSNIYKGNPFTSELKPEVPEFLNCKD